MTGPKHLWSGDWQRESAASADDLDHLAPQAPTDPPSPDADGPRDEPGRRWPRPTQRQQAAIAAVLIVAVIAVALASALGGSSKPASSRTTAQSGLPPSGIAPNQVVPTTPSPTPTTPTVPLPTTPTTPNSATTAPSAPTRVSAGPTVEWLGMEIVNSPSGEVVATVRAGSAGAADGFEPGDVLGSVNGKPVGSANQIRAAVANVKLGSQVQVELDRGSTAITVPVTLTARPTIQP